jgi:hypothetical protein
LRRDIRERARRDCGGGEQAESKAAIDQGSTDVIETGRNDVRDIVVKQ